MINARFESIFHEAALHYAKMGLAVFPLAPKDKRPMISEWNKAATCDPEIINKWWAQVPDANVAIATGAKSGGLFAVDVDFNEDEGKDGFFSLSVWESANSPLPETAMSITGRGGNHYLYRSEVPVASRVAVFDGIDVRGEGGYIVAPPSIHPNGNSYEWDIEHHIDDIGITTVNEGDPVIDLVTYGAAKAGGQFVMPEKIRSGERNDTIFRAACSMQAKGFTDRAILAAASIENEERCDPPLTGAEITEIVSKVFRRYEKGSAAHFNKYDRGAAAHFRKAIR